MEKLSIETRFFVVSLLSLGHTIASNSKKIKKEENITVSLRALYNLTKTFSARRIIMGE